MSQLPTGNVLSIIEHEKCRTSGKKKGWIRMEKKLHCGDLFKRVLSLAMALVMLLSFAPVPHAHAAEGATVYLKPNANWLKDGARFAARFWNDAGETWVDMTDADGDGYYECIVPEEMSLVIFCRMNPGTTENNWTNKWNQTGDLTIPADGKNCFEVPADAWDGSTEGWTTYTPTTPEPEGPEVPDVPSVEATYYVAGVAALCGTEWNEADPNNKMAKGEDGLYTKTYTNVAVGTYGVKVTDGTWDNAWGADGGNYTFEVSAACDVTVTFNEATKAVNVTGANVAKVTKLEVKSIHAVGNGGGNWLDGKNWDAAANAMEKVSDNVYQITFKKVAAGTYKFKFAANGNWADNWGFGAEYTSFGTAADITYNGSDGIFELDGAYDVTLQLDLTNFNYATKKGAKFTISLVAAEVEPTVDYYLVGYINGADCYGTDYKFVNGKVDASFTADSYVFVQDSNGKSYMTDGWQGEVTSATLYDVDTIVENTPDKLKVPANTEVVFTLVENEDGTLTLSYAEVKEEPTVDYYLIGYINGADHGCEADHANLGDYKFVDGKLTATFTQDSYVFVKTGDNANWYMAEKYCTDTSVTLKNTTAGTSEKMLVPGGKELTFTLVENEDGTLTLSYDQTIETPEIPEGYNTVTIHFLKPATWGSTINAWIWDANGKIPGYEAYNTAWPGSPIPENADKAGWYDITVGTAEPQAFNFIFNDGSSQTADLTTGEVTGPTELWVVDGVVYTIAPREWTHYCATIHFQKPAAWGDSINAYAWSENGQLMGEWPGTVTSPSVNEGWYTTIIYLEIGQTLNFIFNDGNGNKTADLTAGKLTGNIELWIDGNGNTVTAPNGWVDAARTIHLPGTLDGNNWNAAGNQMEYDATRGLYTITFDNVTPGTYEYKIAVNGGWGENYGANGEPNGSNMSVTVTEAQDITFWYNDSTHRAVCSVSYDIDAVVSLTGTGITEGTQLTDSDLNGQYTVTVKLTAGTYSDLKITHGEYEIAFNEFSLSADKDVTFTYDPATGMAYHNGSDVKVETKNIYYTTKDLDYKDPFGAVAVGEEVTFAIETGTDATAVVLAIPGMSSVKMEKDGEAVDGVQRWVCTTTFANIGEYQYYFAITNGSDMVFYCDDNWNNYYKKGDYGVGGIGNPDDIFAYDLVVYEAGFETPDWMKNAVIYQIFPDRFFDGDITNNQVQTWARGTVNYEYVEDWYLLPENPEMADDPNYPTYALKGDGEWSNEIYGGDLKGITKKIDYLKALGVNVIYLNPVFWSISNHRYDAVSYAEIDPILGTLGDFEELVAVAEANGMHIILDGVFNHVSDDSVYFDRYYKFLPDAAKKYDGKIGAYPYWAYVYDYMRDNGVDQTTAETAAKTYFGENYGITDYSYTEWFAVQNEWTTNKDKIGLRTDKYVYSYEGWWGYDSMPVIYSTNGSEYQTGNWADEIINGKDSINGYWISKGMDGWRLDVANEVSDETWQNFRDSVKALDSEAVIIGEIWSDATRYLMGDMYDSVMNYVFRDAVAGFARGYLINRDNKAEKYDADLTADEAMTILEILRERYPEEAFYAMMNLVASHDTSRILSYLDDLEDDRYQKDIAHAFPTYEATSDRAKQLQYVVSFLQFTYAGAPTIYYGDEIGMVGGDDPDDRRAFTWGKGNKELVEWYAGLAAIRSAYSALRTGSVEAFSTGNDDVMGFVRGDDTNTLVIMANRAPAAKTISYEGTWVDLISGETFTDSVTVPAYRGVILVAKEKVKNVTVNTADLAPAYDPAYIVAKRSDVPHSHTYNQKVVDDKYLNKAADCENAATYYFSCTCGDKGTETFADGEKLGHAWDDGEITTEPDCENTGVRTYTCERGCTKTETVDALNHAWDDGEITTEPDCENAGVRTYTCERGCTKTEEVEKLGHNYKDGACTRCGEDDPNSVPATPVKPAKPNWKNLLDKIFGNWWGDKDEKPQEPTEPEKPSEPENEPSEPEKPTEPEQTVPSKPITPAKPIWSNIIKKIFGWWKK